MQAKKLLVFMVLDFLGAVLNAVIFMFNGSWVNLLCAIALVICGLFLNYSWHKENYPELPDWAKDFFNEAG